MAVKQTGQFSFVDALLPQAGGSGRLDRLSGLVKWYRFEKLLRGLRAEASAGRPAYPPLVMFKALLLQSLYGLSDAELEEALYDRLSFRRFAGLSLEAAVPDHTTLCRFRNLLTEAGVLEKLFGELDRQLDAAGLILRRGTMLDATIIETGAARPPRERLPGQQVPEQSVDDQPADRDGASPLRLSDPDARFTRRKGRQAGAVLADSAYHTHARAKELKARGIKARLMRRPNKHHKTLPPRLQRLNTLIARRRAAVETTFATWKRRMGLSLIRYRGLAKAEAQVLMTAIAFNMRRWVTLTS